MEWEDKKMFKSRKTIILVSMLMILFLLTACSSGKNDIEVQQPLENDSNQEQQEQQHEQEPLEVLQENEAVVDQEPVQAPKEDVVIAHGDPLFDLLSKNKSEIIKIFGEPDEIDYWSGAEYFYYEDHLMLLYFGSNNKHNNGENVTGIHLLPNGKIMGVTVGMTFEQIKKVLGVPYSEGYNEMDGSYSLAYKIGEHQLLFSAENTEEPTYEGILYGYKSM